MRSRFSAFSVGDVSYLMETWHPGTRPVRLELDPAMRWTRLEIVSAAGGPFDGDGVVEFRAHYVIAGTAGVLHERSRFVRENGRWLYVDGTIYPPSLSAKG
jgi:SEC-C motif-containing protein